MQEFRWINQIPGKSLTGGIEFLNSLSWNISYRQIGEEWFVLSGDQPILKATTREAAEACIYGLALGFAMLTEEMREQFKESVRK